MIEDAERQPEFRFTLDGQMAAVDDYLEVRPENTDRLRVLVATGQLAAGPWQILLDEFLCSGESIIRNLSWAGRARRRWAAACRSATSPTCSATARRCHRSWPGGLPARLRLARRPGGGGPACLPLGGA